MSVPVLVSELCLLTHNVLLHVVAVHSPSATSRLCDLTISDVLRHINADMGQVESSGELDPNHTHKKLVAKRRLQAGRLEFQRDLSHTLAVRSSLWRRDNNVDVELAKNAQKLAHRAVGVELLEIVHQASSMIPRAR